MTSLERQIIEHLSKLGYTYLAINGNHARVFDTEEKPVLKGSLYRIEKDDWTINGQTIFIPGIFESGKFELVDLKQISIQETLF